jgi:hypothetical protein
MRIKPIYLVTLALGLTLGACNRERTPAAAKTASAEDPVVQDIKQIEYGIRLAAANKRIDELERRIGALENTPEKIDLALLTQRMTELEVQRVATLPEVPELGSGVNKRSVIAPPPRVSDKTSRAPAGVPRLSLPDLEKPARVATAAEAKAFASKPQK